MGSSLTRSLYSRTARSFAKHTLRGAPLADCAASPKCNRGDYNLPQEHRAGSALTFATMSLRAHVAKQSSRKRGDYLVAANTPRNDMIIIILP